MGKDFRVGLITGVVLAVAALFWVATRPSLGPQANIAANAPESPTEGAVSENSQSASGTEQASTTPLPWQELPEAPQAAEPLPPASPSPANSVEPQPPEPPREIVREPAPQPNLPDLTIYEQAEPIKTTRFYIVQKGDTLSGIAQQYYGAQSKWRKILSANQKAIKNPNKIAPGTKLIIPD